MKYVQLKEIVEIVRGVTFSKDEGTDQADENRYPVIRAGSIQNELLVNEDQIWVLKEKIKQNQLIRKNDIIMCTSSGSAELVGKCAISSGDVDVSFGAFCVGLRPITKKVIPSFIYHYLRSPAFRNWSKNAGGANIKNLRVSELADFEIPLPQLEEQKRIAAILDKADAIRQKRQQAIALADDFLRSVFLDMFGDPVTNPKGWERIKLGNLISSGPTNGLYKPSSAYGSGTRILRIDGFYDGVLSEQKHFKRVEISKEELSRFSLIERGIVINRVNSPEYLGKCAFIDKLHESTVFESNMMFFTVDEALLNPVFLTQQLQMPNIKQQIKNCSKDAVNQSSINQQDVKSFEILLPNVELQNDFEAVVNEVTRGRKRVSNGQSLTDALFNSISQKAFSGQL